MTRHESSRVAAAFAASSGSSSSSTSPPTSFHAAGSSADPSNAAKRTRRRGALPSEPSVSFGVDQGACASAAAARIRGVAPRGDGPRSAQCRRRAARRSRGLGGGGMPCRRRRAARRRHRGGGGDGRGGGDGCGGGDGRRFRRRPRLRDLVSEACASASPPSSPRPAGGTVRRGRRRGRRLGRRGRRQRRGGRRLRHGDGAGAAHAWRRRGGRNSVAVGDEFVIVDPELREAPLEIHAGGGAAAAQPLHQRTDHGAPLLERRRATATTCAPSRPTAAMAFARSQTARTCRRTGGR